MQTQIQTTQQVFAQRVPRGDLWQQQHPSPPCPSSPVSPAWGHTHGHVHSVSTLAGRRTPHHRPSPAGKLGAERPAGALGTGGRLLAAGVQPATASRGDHSPASHEQSRKDKGQGFQRRMGWGGIVFKIRERKHKVAEIAGQSELGSFGHRRGRTSAPNCWCVEAGR